MKATAKPRPAIGILGAGSVGCYLGGRLATAGARPLMVGRPEMAARLSGGLTVSDHTGSWITIDPIHFAVSTDIDSLAACSTVLVCVKSGDTADAGAALARTVGKETLVASCQNGVSNARVLRQCLPENPVLSAMIGFNVAQVGESRFHRGTKGEILIESDPRAEPLLELLRAAGLECALRTDIDAVLWGKLVLNLNNAVNALSGLPLKRQLADRAYRHVLAAAMREALGVLDAAGIRPATIGRVAPHRIPAILDLPTWLFRVIAANMLKVDSQARSSMAEDMERGRETEIDWLNGEIVSLARTIDVAAPVNARLTELVKAAHAPDGKTRYSGAELMAETGLASATPAAAAA